MPVAGQGDLEEYLAKLTEVGDPVTALAAETETRIRLFTARLRDLEEVTIDTLAELIREDPGFVPIIGAAVGLSQEKLKGQLHHLTGSSAWVTRAREDPRSLVEALDERFGVVERLALSRDKVFTYADVLAARSASQSRAVGAQDSGQLLEDLVEEAVKSLGLPYDTQTRFTGTGGQDAPADFAIPAGFDDAVIAIGVKGYGSTGSKQTTTFGEVRDMANVRRPNQHVFVVADGIGWHRRKSDLRRILELNQSHHISGVFTLEEFDDFQAELRRAAELSRLLPPQP